MRKTIDLTEEDIDRIVEYKQKNGLKSFSDAVRNILRTTDNCTCSDETKLDDENFALIADAIKILDEKLDAILVNFAPKHAGEVKD